MNAIPAPQSTTPSKAGADPTMEEILASIRRIIADDQVLPLTPRPARPTLVDPPAARVEPAVAAPAPQAETDMADEVAAWLDEAAPLRPSIVEQPAVVPPPRIRRVNEEEFTRVIAQQRPEPRPEPRPEARGEPRKIRESVSQPLISAETKSSVATSFQSLAQSVLFRDPEIMENIAREMLRPMLKQWLDDNLPTLVERLVRAEIERVARGGR